jgi:MoxR-like ATPase
LLVRGVPCIGTPLGVQGMTRFDGVVVADTVSDWVDASRRALRTDSDLREAALAGRAELIASHTAEQAQVLLARLVGTPPAAELTEAR